MTPRLFAILALLAAAAAALLEGTTWHTFAQFLAIELGLIAFALALTLLAGGK